MNKIIVEQKIEYVETDDGGQGMKTYLKGSDKNIFFSIQSWDDSIMEHPEYNSREYSEKNAKLGHPIMQQLNGKKVRLTVEILED